MKQVNDDALGLSGFDRRQEIAVAGHENRIGNEMLCGSDTRRQGQYIRVHLSGMLLGQRVIIRREQTRIERFLQVRDHDEWKSWNVPE